MSYHRMVEIVERGIHAFVAALCVLAALLLFGLVISSPSPELMDIIQNGVSPVEPQLD